MAIKTCIFDAYGTLFDVAAAARNAAAEPGREAIATKWPAIAATWRMKQLNYSWLRAVADAHCDFWQVTEDGLDFALEQEGIDDPELRERLLALYWELQAYREVPLMLTKLKAAGYKTGILSNGSPAMPTTEDGARLFNQALDEVLSVQRVREMNLRTARPGPGDDRKAHEWAKRMLRR